MLIHESLRGSLKEAMKAKDPVKLSTVRNIMTACTNELVATNRTPQGQLSDDETLSVIKRLAKQRKESILQYETAGRNELVESEKLELAVLETYLPALMTQADIRSVAEVKKTALGIDDKAEIGMLIGAIMKELGDKADGSDVKAVVKSLF